MAILRIEIKGNQARMDLWEEGAQGLLASAAWEDRRDLSRQLFARMETLLRRGRMSLEQVERVEFSCDSPYFPRRGKWQELQLEHLDGSGRCGFTAWQTGEIIAAVMNFALEK
jgi:hypothetical protein